MVVATPGRLWTLSAEARWTSQVTTLVIDEADEILNMGLEEDVKSLQAPEDMRPVSFSATMPKAS